MAEAPKAADQFEGGLVPSVPAHEEPPLTPTPATPVVHDTVNPALDPATREAIETAMRARDAEIQALRQEIDNVKSSGGGEIGLLDGQASVGGYPWMYWRKPENWPDEGSRGWISVGPGGPTPNGNRDAGSFNVYLKKGLIPVTRYGYVEPPKRPEAIDTFLPILQKGGAKEFPASQVIAYKWHINPPIRGIVFPQYEEVKDTIISFECEACGHTQFFMPNDTGTAGEVLRGHLMSTHKYPFREAAEAVKAAGLTVKSGATVVRGLPPRD